MLSARAASANFNVAYRASAISAISTWQSPVLLWHGDDDRNVAFSQTTGLVQLLRAHDVEFELIVQPDDTHETLLHSRWIDTFGRMETFLKKHNGRPVQASEHLTNKVLAHGAGE